jgi:hypothetical protein
MPKSVVPIATRLSESMASLLKDAANALKGESRRLFMAKTTKELGHGGQRLAERELGWCRETIRKAMRELNGGIVSVNAFNMRGRTKYVERLPRLVDDIRDIADQHVQIDATFRTEKTYLRLTAEQCLKELQEKGYSREELPSRRTMNDILNQLGLRLRTVVKNRPAKKVPETDAIFEQLQVVNHEADATQGVLRISMDAKAAVKIGLFSRRGKSRVKVNASDHDYQPDAVLTPYSIFLPKYGKLYIFMAESKVTADFIWDRLDELWSELHEQYRPHTLVLNQDNGPENSSRRTQFIKRAVEFAQKNNVIIKLAYYPPYHSKYNPVERTHGALENYWNGMLLCDVETALNAARNMTWKGLHPIVRLVSDIYEKGVKLAKKAMADLERRIDRLPGLKDWFVEIKPAAT